MGLQVQSLESIPTEIPGRDYFIYVLDYGWKEPLAGALRDNFEEMARESENNRAVAIRGLKEHFENEVFSWHHINGCDGEEVLPALLITNRPPIYFRDNQHGPNWQNGLYRESEHDGMKLVLIPLKKFCKTTTDVINLIQQIYSDIRANRKLKDFAVAKEMRKGLGTAIVDGLILSPNLHGVGIDLKKIFRKK